MRARRDHAHLAALLFPPTLRRLYLALDADEAGARGLKRLTGHGRAWGAEVRPLVPQAEGANADLQAVWVGGLGGVYERRHGEPARGAPDLRRHRDAMPPVD